MNKDNKSYHKLIVWQKLKELVIVTYHLINKLPRSEEFGLISQMKRAAISVISNFVEGYLKRSTKEKLLYMERAETSLLELEAQSEICLILNYWTEKEYQQFDDKRKLAAYFLYKYVSKISS